MEFRIGIVSGGALNSTHSLTHSLTFVDFAMVDNPRFAIRISTLSVIITEI